MWSSFGPLVVVAIAIWDLPGSTQGGAHPDCTVDPSSGAVTSPHGSHGSKSKEGLGVYVFPLLAPESAASIAKLSEAAASSLGGWRSDRHSHYATTDIEVRGSPELRSAIEPLLGQIARRSADALADYLGVDDEGSTGLVFHDIFVVRYEASGQRGLDAHEDGSRATFQVTLGIEGLDFEGGGTFFEALGCRLQPPAGSALVFPGGLRHAGLDVVAGRRYVLVGFSRRAGASADDQHLHLSFGLSYQIVLSPKGQEPCLEGDDGVSGVTLRARVMWRGCSDTAFGLRVQYKPKGHGGSMVGLVWLERRVGGESCESEALFERPLRLRPEGGQLSVNATSFLALPPGHNYVSYGLRPCGAQHSAAAICSRANPFKTW